MDEANQENGQCAKCDEDDRLTTVVISDEPFADDSFDVDDCICLCPGCYLSAAKGDGIYVREFPVQDYWNSGEMNETHGVGDRRVTMHPSEIREWISYPAWLESDLSEWE